MILCGTPNTELMVTNASQQLPDKRNINCLKAINNVLKSKAVSFIERLVHQSDVKTEWLVLNYRTVNHLRQPEAGQVVQFSSHVDSG